MNSLFLIKFHYSDIFSSILPISYLGTVSSANFFILATASTLSSSCCAICSQLSPLLNFLHTNDIKNSSIPACLPTRLPSSIPSYPLHVLTLSHPQAIHSNAYTPSSILYLILFVPLLILI